MAAELNKVFQWMRRSGDQPLRTRLTRHYTSEQVTSSEEGAELNLPGLYGRHGILPDYFTDELLADDSDHSAMRDFLDFFDARYYTLLFATWNRYQFFLESALGGEETSDEAFFLDRLAGLLGQREMPLFLKGLRWNKLAIYRKQARTREGLYALVHSFFPDLELELETFVVVQRLIPKDQQAVLGQNLRLGADGNLLTGKTIADPSGGIRMFFKNLDYDAYMDLLPGGKCRELLTELVADFTRGDRDCMVRLELRADQVPGWQLGNRCIGRDVWLLTQAASASVCVEAGRL